MSEDAQTNKSSDIVQDLSSCGTKAKEKMILVGMSIEMWKALQIIIAVYDDQSTYSEDPPPYVLAERIERHTFGKAPRLV